MLKTFFLFAGISDEEMSGQIKVNGCSQACINNAGGIEDLSIVTKELL